MTYGEIMMNQLTLAQYAELFLRIVVSCLCGGIVGFERTRRYKEAGIRTHIIVCAASAMLMIVSKYGFLDVEYLAGSHNSDPARLAAQIISGISFLGAGVIFHNGSTTKGLTTAAGVWAISGVGIAIGAGMYPLGIFVTAVICLIQFIMHKVEIGADAVNNYQLRFTVKNSEDFRKSVAEFLEEQKAQTLESKVKFDEDGFVTYNLTIRTQSEIDIEKLNFFLESIGEVKSVSCVSMN